jgi:hypothetical protein
VRVVERRRRRRRKKKIDYKKQLVLFLKKNSSERLDFFLQFEPIDIVLNRSDPLFLFRITNKKNHEN